MATNIFSLKKSELELKENFFEFLELVHKMHHKTYTILAKEAIAEDDAKALQNYKMLVKEKKRDIIDDCIWILSKDQPRANHLRYIIATLYSARDVERICQQSYRIISYARLFQMKEPFKQVVLKYLTYSKELFDQLLQIFSNSEKLDNFKNFVREAERFEKASDEFRESYHRNIGRMIDETTTSGLKETDPFYSFSISMKYIDRIVDHLGFVIQNFLMIKNID